MTNSPSTANSNCLISHLNLRILLLYFIALSPSLGTAVSAFGRLFLYITALCIFLFSSASKERKSIQNLHYLTILILITVGYMLTTVAWSSVPLSESLHAWTRHARLLTIPILYILIRNPSEGKAVLRVFAFGQVFVILSAWLLVCGVKVPWATAAAAKETYAVFGSYLEQSISQSVLVAILWFERDWIFGRKGHWLAIFGALSTLVLTLGFLQGRSGHVVALTIIGLAVLYELPRRQKWIAVVIVAGVLAITVAGSKNFRDRMLSVNSEVAAYSERTVADSSSGVRLYYWHVSLLAAIEKPIFGHGAGSWNHEYRRLGANKANPLTLSVSDPHQLFLLWAVEGGAVGLGLLIIVFAYMLLKSRYLEINNAHTLQAVIMALIISGMFNSMIFGIGMGDFFCVAIGILLSMSHRIANSSDEKKHDAN
jgi:O-antigen ligase